MLDMGDLTVCRAWITLTLKASTAVRLCVCVCVCVCVCGVGLNVGVAALRGKYGFIQYLPAQAYCSL